MMKDNALISIGGNDKTNMVWTTSFGDESHPGRNMLFFDKKVVDGEEEEEELDEDYDLGLDVVDVKPIRDKYSNDRQSTKDSFSNSFADPKEGTQITEGLGGGAFDGGFQFEMEEVQAGEEFGAVKPWIGQIT
jgi:hypothetical protein